jgi:hypothetical protein
MPEMMENILLCNGNLRFAAIGLNQQMLPVFLGLLLAAAGAWLFLSNRLYAELRQNYPGLYESLGSPKRIMKKSFRANFKVISFLFKQGYEATDDPKVIRLCQGLRSLFYIYMICLAGCLVLLLDRLG